MAKYLYPTKHQVPFPVPPKEGKKSSVTEVDDKYLTTPAGSRWKISKHYGTMNTTKAPIN